MHGPPKQAPPPLQVDTARVVLAGMAVWAVALVVLLLLGDRVAPLWIWTCIAALALAVLGLGVMRWQGQLKDSSAPHRTQARGGTPREGRSGDL